MRPDQRVVTRLPLTELWSSAGSIDGARRVRKLSVADIKASLRAGTVAFVIADVGHALDWIDPKRSFDVWNREIQPHLADPSLERIYLEDFPNAYAYWASEWHAPDRDPIIVLEKAH